MTDLRNHLVATLEALHDKDEPMDIDRAKAIADVAKVLVDSAKVEVAFIAAKDGEATSPRREEARLGQSYCPILIQGHSAQGRFGDQRCGRSQPVTGAFQRGDHRTGVPPRGGHRQPYKMTEFWNSCRKVSERLAF